MPFRAFFLASLTVAAICATGCSSSSSSNEPNLQIGDQATCDFMHDQNNCLNKMFANVDACLGAAPPSGRMSADGATCTSADGRVSVTFDPAFTSVDTPPKSYDATILDAGGKACAHFVRTADGGFSLTDSTGKTTTLVYVQPHEVKLTCPDGSGWQDNDQDVCLIVLPGETAESYGTAGVDVKIMGTKESLFHCAAAPGA